MLTFPLNNILIVFLKHKTKIFYFQYYEVIPAIFGAVFSVYLELLVSISLLVVRKTFKTTLKVYFINAMMNAKYDTFFSFVCLEYLREDASFKTMVFYRIVYSTHFIFLRLICIANINKKSAYFAVDILFVKP